MKLALNSNAWRMIYHHLRQEHYDINDDGPASRKDIEKFFKGYGVIIKTDTDGRWEEVEIVLDEEELTVFLLRWA